MNALLAKDLVPLFRDRRFFVARTVAGAIALVLVIALAAGPAGALAAGAHTASCLLSATIGLLAIAFVLLPVVAAHGLARGGRQADLEVLLSTPLSARAVVLSKWIATAGIGALVLVATVPMFAAGLLWGGVSWAQALAVPALVLATTLWVAAVGVAAAARSDDLGSALIASYAVSGGVLAAGLVAGFAASRSGAPPILGWLRAANPFLLAQDVFGSASTAAGRAASQLAAGRGLAAGATLAALALAAAAWRVRGGTLFLARGGAGRGAARGPRLASMLESSPHVWLELVRTVGARRRMFALSAALIAVVEAWYWNSLPSYAAGIGPGSRAVLNRLVIEIFSNAAVFGSTVIAAIALHRDADHQLLEVLHTTPANNRAIVRSRVLAALLPFSLCALAAMAHVVLGVARGEIWPGSAIAYAPVFGGIWVFAARTGSACALAARTAGQAAARAAGTVLWISAMGVVLFGSYVSGSRGSGWASIHAFIGTLPPDSRDGPLGTVIFATFWLGVVTWLPVFTDKSQRLETFYGRRRTDWTHPDPTHIPERVPRRRRWYAP